MANQTTKVYRIEIEMSAARQALDDANKKLARLDQQLEGLDQNGDAAKKITAEMAKLVGEIERLEQGVEGFGQQLNALKPGSFGALKAEVEELERAFDGAVKGTKEYDELLLKLGRKNAEIDKIENSVRALNEETRSGALVDFANGIAGVVTVSTAAAQSLGLSASSAEAYEKSMQTAVAITSSFEAISKALNSETQTNIKSLLQSAKAALGFGEASTQGGRAAKIALASTGIGLIVVLLGTLIANFDRLTSSVQGSATVMSKVKAVASGLFDAAIASLKVYGGLLADLFTGNIPQLIVDAQGAGKKIGDAYTKGYQESLFEGYKKTIQQQIDYNEQLLKVQEASGRSSYQLQRKILQDKIVVAKEGSEEEKKAKLDLIGDLAAMDRAEQVKQKKAAVDAAQARLEAVIAVEQAKGNELFKKQLDLENRKLAALQAAAQPDAAAIIAQRGQIAALIASHEQQQYDKRRAALLERQQAEVALLEAQGQLTLDLRIQQARERLALDTGTNEKALAEKRADNEALKLLLVEQANFEKDIRQKNFEQAQDMQAANAEIDKRATEGLEEGARAVLQKSDDLNKQFDKADLGRTILTKFFRVKKEDVEKVKAELNQAFAEIAQSVGQVVGTMLTQGMAAADTAIQAAQDRLSQLDQQLSETSSKREADEQKAAESTGARRDYYLQQLAKARAEEQRLASEKAKAAKQEQEAAQTKARLQAEQNKISAASTAIEGLLLGIKAAQTLVDIASKGKFGVDNLVLAVAATATLGAGIFAMKNAAATFEEGGLVGGPRHSQGGIQLFHRTGAHLGEMEGGEFINNRQSTSHNMPWLDLINTAGRTRPLSILDFVNAATSVPYEILPPPASYYANGGVLSSGGAAPAGGYASAADLNALRADVQQTNALLGQMLNHAAETAAATANTADHTGQIRDYGPAQLLFGQEAEMKRRELAQGMDDTKRAVIL